MKRAFPLIAALAVLLAGGALGYIAYRVSRPYRGWQQPAVVDIAPGTSSRAIAAQLRGAGVLRNEWPFLLLHYLRPGKKLKAGEYYFDRPYTPREVVEKLRRGDVYYHALTIPEGYNIFEIVDAAAATGLVSRQDMAQAVRDASLISDLDPSATALEGYLFPDTYHFPRRTSAAQIASAMVARFRKVYRELDSRHSPGRPAREIVTLASLIEKETRVPDERPLVAGVFYNRLGANLPLQCDPTVIYAALLAGRYRGAIYQGDLSFRSPYNTYLARGLPPGPIANPGRSSLEAAMAPAATDYLYFVSNGQGGHRFSSSLAEHSRAVSEYRRAGNGGQARATPGSKEKNDLSNRTDSGRRHRQGGRARRAARPGARG